MAAKCYSVAGVNGKTGKTVRKINLKRKNSTASSEQGKTKLIKTDPNQTHGV